MNICVQVLVWAYVFKLEWHIPKSRLAGSYGNSVYPFEKLPDHFPKWLHHFPLLPAVYEDSSFSMALAALMNHHLTLAILVCMKRYLIVVLISISLMTDDFELLSCTYWLFVYLLRISICSDPLPIFKLGYLCFYC